MKNGYNYQTTDRMINMKNINLELNQFIGS